MRLDELLAGAGTVEPRLEWDLVGEPATDIGGVTMDSRAVGAGTLFACVPGRTSDGHDFAPEAVARGATALLCERRLALSVPQVLVVSTRRALGPVAASFHGFPSRDLTVVGVTGTNGKTTSCALLAGVFEAVGWRSTVIGTLTQQRTTPEAPELQALLAGWRDAGGRAVSMEVSSHALAQHRADAIEFAAGIFTNLTPEHLDFHGTMDDYFEAKARLFSPGRVRMAVVNGDDGWGRRLAERLSGQGTPLRLYSMDDAGDLRLGPGGSSFVFDGQPVKIRLPGRFNVANALAAAACARALGLDPPDIARGLASVDGVAGRFQRVDAGQSFTVLVDYAHTPDGLAKALGAARELGSGRLLVVFGAGGDRDHEKRPLMGAAAAERADLAVVTSDNPRGEDPDEIISQILSGIGGRHNVVVEPDRANAISVALANARAGDVVVIAGKGHERGQEVAGRTSPFDDAEVARSALERILASRGDEA